MKNKKNIKKDISRYLTKKNIILGSMALTLTAVPVGLCISHFSTTRFIFDNKTFNSMNSVVKYVKNNSEKTSVEGYGSTWSFIDENGRVQTFNSPKELQDEIFEKYAKERTVKTNVNLKNYVNESGVISESARPYIYDVKNETVKAYQGLNNVVYNNEDEAYNSYFNKSVKNALYFNNIYFDNKEDLREYLIKDYFPNQREINKNSTIILKGANGIVSSPINLNSQNAFVEVLSFIESNSQKTLRYTNSVSKKSFDITKDNIDKIHNEVRFDDLDYIHMHSNEGESRYVIDNMDDNNLIGPYFYEGTLDIGSFTNKKMWKKVNGVNHKAYAESKVDSMIGSFFSTIINDDNVVNLYEAQEQGKDPLLFRTMLQSPIKEMTYDEWFLIELGKINKSLKNEVVSANFNLMNGNKYNTFFKIPVLYSFLMQRIVSYNLGQEALNLVLDYFTNVCDFIQDAIEIVTLNNPVILQGFNVKKFFNIGNGEYDLNTSSTFFLNEIKKNYPNLIAAMSTYIGAQNNIIMSSGLIPFKSIDNDYLVDFGIFKDEFSYYSIEEHIKPIYEIFSKLSYDEMLVLFIKHSHRADVKALDSKKLETQKEEFNKLSTLHTKTSLNSMLTGMASKNSTNFALSESILRLEIKTYLETGAIIRGGYLGKIYSHDKSIDKLGAFINLISANPEMNAYQVYMAILIDRRTNAGIFTQQNLSNSSDFAIALTRLISSSLGTAYMTGVSINRIHNHYRSNNFNRGNGTPGAGIGSNTPSNRPSSPSQSSWDSTFDDTTSWWSETNVSSSSTWNPSLGEDASAVPTVSNHPTLKLFYEDAISTHVSSNQVIQRTGGIDFHKKPRGGFLTKFAEESGWMEYVHTNIMPELLNPIVREEQRIPDIKLELKSAEELLDWSYNSIPAKNKAEALSRVDSVLSIRSRRSSTSSKSTATFVSPLDESFARISKKFDQINNMIDEWEIEISSTPSLGSGGTFPSLSPTPSEISRERRKAKWAGIVNFDKVKDGLRKVTNFSSTIFASVATGLEIFFFVYELLKTNHTQDFYVYTTANGTNFYWDGGLTVDKYMGLEVKQVAGIEGMELINPVQVTLPQISEYYYFNSNRYYDRSELKYDQIKYMLNGGSVAKTSNFASNYSLIPLDNNYVQKATSIEELTNNVLTDLHLVKNEDGSINASNLNKNSIYLSASMNLISGNITDDNTSAAAEHIVNNIRYTSIAVLPDLESGFANGKVSTNFIDETNKFIFPGAVYRNSAIVQPSASVDKTKYVIDNTANDLKSNINLSGTLPESQHYVIEDASKAIESSKDKLFNRYKSSFLLKNKNILTRENSKNNFNDLNDGYEIKKIYTVKLSGKEIGFADLESVMNYLMKKYNAQKNFNYTGETAYIYNGIYFANDKKLNKWISENVKNAK